MPLNKETKETKPKINRFGIKYPTNVDMPLNKETKPKIDLVLNNPQRLICHRTNLSKKPKQRLITLQIQKNK